MKLKDFLEKIKSIKHIEIYIALILIIVAIIVYFAVEDKDEVKNKSELEIILSQIDGVGECEVMITYKDEGKMFENKKAVGAVVICDGAQDIRVVEKITIALKTLLDINSTNIKVYKTKS